MNFYEIMFILQFLGLLTILGYKLWFILSLGKTFDIRVSFFLFGGFFIPYILGFLIFMTNPEILIYQMLFNFETWLVGLNILFFAIEIMFHLGVVATKPISAYKSIDYTKSPHMR